MYLGGGWQLDSGKQACSGGFSGQRKDGGLQACDGSVPGDCYLVKERMAARYEQVGGTVLCKTCMVYV
jgi:hypothetical protein